MHAIAPVPTPAPTTPEEMLRRKEALGEEYEAGFDAPPADPLRDEQ